MPTEPSPRPDLPATIVNRRVLLQAVSAGMAATVLGRASANEAETREANATPDVSLAGQRLRGQAMLRTAVAIGDRYYDESAGLIVMREHAVEARIREKYNGGWVAWKSPSYATTLFKTGARLDRANRIVSRICDHLERDAGQPLFGNVRAISEWKSVQDNNAIVFVMYELVPIWLKHQDKLQAVVREKVREFLRIGAVGVVRRQPDWFYSNIFLLTLASTLMLAKALNREDLADLAGRQWRRWLELLAENNVVESNSPAYFLYHVGPTLAIAEYAVDERMRLQARRAADLMLIQLAGNYHRPSGMLGGPACRSYLANCLTGQGGYELLMHQYFDVPLRAECSDPASGDDSILSCTTITPYPHEIPDVARRLVWERSYPDTLVTSYGSYFGKDDAPVAIACTNYQDEEIGIGSQYGGWQHYHQEVPLWIVHSGRQNRRTIFLRGGPDNCMIDSYFTQRDRRVLGITCWRPYDWAATRAWWQKGSPFLVEHRLNLGPAKDYNLLRIDGQPFKDEAAITENGVLFAEKPGLGIALRLMVPPMGARRTPARLTVDPSGDLVAIVEYASSPSVDGFLKLTASACGWLVRVFSPRLASSREIESEFLRASIETSQPKPGSWKLRLTDGLEVIAPVTPEARQQYEAEHRPPVGALVTHPLFSLPSTDSARRWLHIEG